MLDDETENLRNPSLTVENRLNIKKYIDRTDILLLIWLGCSIIICFTRPYFADVTFSSLFIVAL